MSKLRYNIMLGQESVSYKITYRTSNIYYCTNVKHPISGLHSTYFSPPCQSPFTPFKNLPAGALMSNFPLNELLVLHSQARKQ